MFIWSWREELARLKGSLAEPGGFVAENADELGYFYMPRIPDTAGELLDKIDGKA